jgi:hypothetical protein
MLDREHRDNTDHGHADPRAPRGGRPESARAPCTSQASSTDQQASTSSRALV